MSQFETVLVCPSCSSVIITYLPVTRVSIWMINFIVNLAMELPEMEVVLKQRQEVDCWARRWGDDGNATDVRSSTAQPRTGVGLH